MPPSQKPQETLTFHVAALGAPFPGLFEAPWDETSAGWGARYRDRPQVDVTVSTHATLLDVILEASESLGVTTGEWARETLQDDGRPMELRDLFRFVAFYSPQDRREYRGAEPEMWGLTVLDADGLAYRKRWQEVPVGDLLRAAEEGLIDGDPLRPYLIPQPSGGGDFIASQWDVVHIVLDLGWDALDVLARLGGAWAAIEVARRLGHRLRRAGDAAGANAEGWTERGLSPRHLADLVATRTSWDADELATLLGVSREHAEGMLLGLGWSRGDESWFKDDASDATRSSDLLLSAAGLDEWWHRPLRLLRARRGVRRWAGLVVLTLRARHQRRSLFRIPWRVRAWWYARRESPDDEDDLDSPS